MGTRGAGTYPQGAKYAFIRSYIERFAISDTGITVTQTANLFTLHAPTLPAYTFIVRVPATWYLWNSNGYSLDYVVEDSYYTVSPDPTKIPLDFALVMVFPTNGYGAYLQYCPSGILATPIFGHLPAPPANYWLPKWLR